MGVSACLRLLAWTTTAALFGGPLLCTSAEGHVFQKNFLRKSQSVSLRRSSRRSSSVANAKDGAFFQEGFYHTSDELHQKLVDLSTKCHGLLTLETQKRSGVEIDLVTVSSGPKQNRFFMLFGEHARELISPESSLHFIETLCAEEQSDKVKEVLASTEFQMVVNGNPNSRRKVEGGDYCLRVNANGVDLNRNWDEKWEPEAEAISPDTNPGPKPFSEEETNIFREAVAEYKPTSFLTVHSGTKGMYMPWAFDMQHEAKKNNLVMQQILETLDTQYCKCPFGAAGREVGYSCPGTCLDYVYDHLGVDYSFAFEIYTRKSDWPELEERYGEKMQRYRASRQPSDFFQMRAYDKQRLEEEECFERFNPSDQQDFQETLETWTNVYLDMANKIAADLTGKDGAAFLINEAPPASSLAAVSETAAEKKPTDESGAFKWDFSADLAKN